MNVLDNDRDWDKIFIDWATSKLSQKEYCKLNNLKYSSFKIQRYKTKLHVTKKPSKRMLPINISSDKETSLSDITIQLPSSAILSLSPIITPKELKNILSELGLL